MVLNFICDVRQLSEDVLTWRPTLRTEQFTAESTTKNKLTNKNDTGGSEWKLAALLIDDIHYEE